MLVIDAANVIGSLTMGWWRDRPGAARQLTERVRATVVAGRLDPRVTIVLEGQAKRGAKEAVSGGVEAVHAPGEGDDTIAAIAAAHDEVVVVTADRGLAAAGADEQRRGGRAELAARPAGGLNRGAAPPGTSGGREPPARSLRSSERSSAGAEGCSGGFRELVHNRRAGR